jgi:predicted ATP-dependent endonuclease of OLD family
MKIKKVEIRDYKVFYGLNEFNVEGKNLFIYGENRSGKSTIYRALYTLSFTTTNASNTSLETLSASNAVSTRYIIAIIFCRGVSL